MNNTPPNDDDLLLVCGELEPARRAEVQSAIQTDPAKAAQVAHLSQTLQALRAMDATGPSPGFNDALRQRLVAREQPPLSEGATLQVAERKPFSLLRWIKDMKPRNRFVAAAASLLIATAAIGSIVLVTFTHPGVAFADVKENLKNAKTVQMTVQISKGAATDQHASVVRMKVFVRFPGLIREEIENGLVSVLDLNRKRTLWLEQRGKTGFTLDSVGTPESEPERMVQNPLEGIRQMLDGSEKPLGQRDIDGKKARGFLVTKDRTQMEVWADDATGQPLLIKMKVGGNGFPDSMVIIREIVLNKEIPDSLLSLDLPADYTIKDPRASQIPDIGTVSEKDLAEGLRMLGKSNGYVFPQAFMGTTPEMMRIRDKAAVEEWIAKMPGSYRTWDGKLKQVGPPPTTQPEEDFREIHQLFNRMIAFAANQKTHDFHYAGGGVLLGNGFKPIAWWQPAGTKDYRVLLGDLTFAMWPADKLPVAASIAHRPGIEERTVRVRVMGSAPPSDMSVAALRLPVVIRREKPATATTQPDEFDINRARRMRATLLAENGMVIWEGTIAGPGATTGPATQSADIPLPAQLRSWREAVNARIDAATRAATQPATRPGTPLVVAVGDTLSIDDPRGNRDKREILGPVKIIIYDSEAAEVAAVDNLEVGTALTVTAEKPATQPITAPSWPKLNVHLKDVAGNDKDITQHQP